MVIEEKLKSEKKNILASAKTHGARNIRIFGSLSRGEAHSNSDLDLLVDMEKGRTYFDLVGFWQDVEDIMGCRVDVVTEGGLSPYLRDTIQQEARPL